MGRGSLFGRAGYGGDLIHCSAEGVGDAHVGAVIVNLLRARRATMPRRRIGVAVERSGDNFGAGRICEVKRPHGVIDEVSAQAESRWVLRVSGAGDGNRTNPNEPNKRVTTRSALQLESNGV